MNESKLLESFHSVSDKQSRGKFLNNFVDLYQLFFCSSQLLFPLLEKCGVTLDPKVMKHSFFSCDLR